MDLNPTIPIITLNINNLKTPIKRQWYSDGQKKKKKKHDPSISCP